MRTAACTILALIAFAANAVLCRIALRGGSIDAASFAPIRLAAAAAALLLVTAWTRNETRHTTGSWTSAGLLFLYAVPFYSSPSRRARSHPDWVTWCGRWRSAASRRRALPSCNWRCPFSLLQAV